MSRARAGLSVLGLLNHRAMYKTSNGQRRPQPSIVCHYRNQDDERVDVQAVLTELGYAVAGQTEAPGVSIAWCEQCR